MARTHTTVTVRLVMAPEVLTMATVTALYRRGHVVAVVTRAIRDHADRLPAHVLDDLHGLIDRWLKHEGRLAASFDREPWHVALAAVRAARQQVTR